MGPREERRQPLADKMFDQLLGELLSGARAAGEQLNIGQLSRDYEVSQTPLREALARLEHTGMVVRVALKGYRVAPALTKAEVAKLLYAREVLEPAIAYEAALRTTPEFLAELAGQVEAVAATTEQADVDPVAFLEYGAADNQFHVLITDQCDNEFLQTAMRSLEGHLARFRLFSKLENTGAGHAASEHQWIYEAFAAGDAELASERMREHIRGTARRHQEERAPRSA